MGKALRNPPIRKVLSRGAPEEGLKRRDRAFVIFVRRQLLAEAFTGDTVYRPDPCDVLSEFQLKLQAELRRVSSV